MATIQFTQGQDSPPTPASRAKQLLPNIVDGMARTRPEAIYAQIPNSFTSYDSGYRKISYRDLANCVNGLAWLLTQQLGPGKDCETLAYVGPNDIGYVCMILAAVKAGYSVSGPSYNQSVYGLTCSTDSFAFSPQHDSRSR